MTRIELRGAVEALTGRGHITVASGGTTTVSELVQELAHHSNELRHLLLTDNGEPRESVKIMIGGEVPVCSYVITDETLKIVAALPCDG